MAAGRASAHRRLRHPAAPDRATPAGLALAQPLDGSRRPTHTPRTSRRTGCERDEYPSHVDPETRRLVRAGTTTAGNGPGSLRTEREAARAADASRLRRRAPAITGQRRSAPVATPADPSVTRVRHRRMRVAPRKARPFVPETNGRFDSPRRTAMTTADPISLAQAQAPGRDRRHDPAARDAPGRPRDARSGRSCASTTAGRPTSSSRSRAANASGATRSSASARGGSSRCATASPASRPGRSPCPVYAPDLPIETDPTPRTRSPRSARSSRAAGSSRPRACRASPAARSVPSPMTRSPRSSRPSRSPTAIRSASRPPPSSRRTSSSSSTT